MTIQIKELYVHNFKFILPEKKKLLFHYDQFSLSFAIPKANKDGVLEDVIGATSLLAPNGTGKTMLAGITYGTFCPENSAFKKYSGSEGREISEYLFSYASDKPIIVGIYLADFDIVLARALIKNKDGDKTEQLFFHCNKETFESAESPWKKKDVSYQELAAWCNKRYNENTNNYYTTSGADWKKRLRKEFGIEQPKVLASWRAISKEGGTSGMLLGNKTQRDFIGKLMPHALPDTDSEELFTELQDCHKKLGARPIKQAALAAFQILDKHTETYAKKIDDLMKAKTDLAQTALSAAKYSKAIGEELDAIAKAEGEKIASQKNMQEERKDALDRLPKEEEKAQNYQYEVYTRAEEELSQKNAALTKELNTARRKVEVATAAPTFKLIIDAQMQCKLVQAEIDAFDQSSGAIDLVKSRDSKHKTTYSYGLHVKYDLTARLQRKLAEISSLEEKERDLGIKKGAKDTEAGIAFGLATGAQNEINQLQSTINALRKDHPFSLTEAKQNLDHHQSLLAGNTITVDESRVTLQTIALEKQQLESDIQVKQAAHDQRKDDIASYNSKLVAVQDHEGLKYLDGKVENPLAVVRALKDINATTNDSLLNHKIEYQRLLATKNNIEHFGVDFVSAEQITAIKKLKSQKIDARPANQYISTLKSEEAKNFITNHPGHASCGLVFDSEAERDKAAGIINVTNTPLFLFVAGEKIGETVEATITDARARFYDNFAANEYAGLESSGDGTERDDLAQAIRTVQKEIGDYDTKIKTINDCLSHIDKLKELFDIAEKAKEFVEIIAKDLDADNVKLLDHGRNHERHTELLAQAEKAVKTNTANIAEADKHVAGVSQIAKLNDDSAKKERDKKKHETDGITCKNAAEEAQKELTETQILHAGATTSKVKIELDELDFNKRFIELGTIKGATPEKGNFDIALKAYLEAKDLVDKNESAKKEPLLFKRGQYQATIDANTTILPRNSAMLKVEAYELIESGENLVDVKIMADSLLDIAQKAFDGNRQQLGFASRDLEGFKKIYRDKDPKRVFLRIHGDNIGELLEAALEAVADIKNQIDRLKDAISGLRDEIATITESKNTYVAEKAKADSIVDGRKFTLEGEELPQIHIATIKERIEQIREKHAGIMGAEKTYELAADELDRKFWDYITGLKDISPKFYEDHNPDKNQNKLEIAKDAVKVRQVGKAIKLQITYLIGFLENLEGRMDGCLQFSLEKLADVLGRLDRPTKMRIGPEKLPIMKSNISKLSDARDVIKAELMKYITNAGNFGNNTGSLQKAGTSAAVDIIMASGAELFKHNGTPILSPFEMTCIRPDMQGYDPVNSVPSSGGELAATAIMIVLAMMSDQNKESFSGKKVNTMLMMDNPFGALSNHSFIKMFIKQAEESGVQLVCFTHLGLPQLHIHFDLLYTFSRADREVIKKNGEKAMRPAGPITLSEVIFPNRDWGRLKSQTAHDIPDANPDEDDFDELDDSEGDVDDD